MLVYCLAATVTEPESALQGRERFEDLYVAYYPAIYKYVARRLRVTSASQDASDVTAEVFLTVWRRISDLPRPPGDRLWIYGVARRTVERQQRGATRWDRLHLKLRTKTVQTTPADRDDEPAVRVRAALVALKPRDRESVYLVLWDGLSHAEAAEVLGCSVNALAVRLHRARSRLRARLAPLADTPAVPADDVAETLKER
jgi:RNA polymerase sigma factor (sigma-70 family)